MKKNAVLLSRVDREDYWVRSGIVIKVTNTNFYEETYNEIKEKIEKPEMIDYIINKNCLLADYFDGDESYKFRETNWGNGINFVFMNDEGNDVEFNLKFDYVLSL